MEPEKRTSSVKVLDGNVFVSFHLLHLGKGTMFTASFLRSALSWPGNLEGGVGVKQLLTKNMFLDALASLRPILFSESVSQ